MCLFRTGVSMFAVGTKTRRRVFCAGVAMKAESGLSRVWCAIVTVTCVLLCGPLGRRVDAWAGPPVSDGPVQVSFFMAVLDVDSIDSADMSFEANVYFEARWQDSRLAHEGKGEKAYDLTAVWHPRLQLANRKRVFPTLPEIVEVSPEGQVVYRQRVWGSFSQAMNLEDFPLDRHEFNIHVMAAGYSPEEVVIVQNPDMPSGFAEKLSLPDWDVLDWSAEPALYMIRKEGAKSPGFLLTFNAERHVGYFVAKVIVPLMLIVAMSWVVFWIDPQEAAAQINVAVTAMLTLIAYRFAVGIFVPKISYLTRLDFFILSSTVLVFASLIEVVVTSALARGAHLPWARWLDRASRLVFPAVFAYLVFRAFIA